MSIHDDQTSRNPINRPAVQDGGFGWGIPLAIAAVALVAGLLFFNSSSNPTNTAQNNSPTTNQGTRAPTAPTVTPAPTPAPTAPKGG